MPVTAIIIQARMTSSRLPGKVMMPVLGRPLLDILLERMAAARAADCVVVATTTNAADDPVAALAVQRGAAVWRGDEHDVLARMHGAAQSVQAGTLVRVTADCPLLDPALVDEHIRLAQYGILPGAPAPDHPAPHGADAAYDYVGDSNAMWLPNGMSCEVVSFAALDKAHREATDPYEREHVTLHVQRPDRHYRIAALPPRLQAGDLRLCVDTAEDFALVTRVLEALLPGRGIGFTLEDVVALMRANPDWALLNRHVRQTTGPYANA